MPDRVPWPRGRIIPAVGLLLCGALLAGPAAAQQGAGDARLGQRLAAARCAACHGTSGMASQSDTPNLAGQNPAYVEIQLRAFRTGERLHAPMNAVARELTDAQISSLAAWFTAIQVEVTLPGR